MIPTVAILSPLGAHTGNRSTALRLQLLLDCMDFTCVLAPDGVGEEGDQEARASSLAAWGLAHSVKLVVALHAYRSGALLVTKAWRKTNIPFLVVFGGTDLSTYIERTDELAIMTSAVTMAAGLVAFSHPMRAVAVRLWPKLAEKIVLIPQAVAEPKPQPSQPPQVSHASAAAAVVAPAAVVTPTTTPPPLPGT
jgi:hypothetical protein